MASCCLQCVFAPLVQDFNPYAYVSRVKVKTWRMDRGFLLMGIQIPVNGLKIIPLYDEITQAFTMAMGPAFLQPASCSKGHKACRMYLLSW